MSKAEEFIKNHTNNQANISMEISNGGKMRSYSIPWLTLEDTRKAVEIAREEMIEETAEWLTKHAKKYYFNKDRYLGTDELVEDYKLIMSMNYE